MKPAAASGEAPKRAALSTDFYSILGLRPGADGQKIKAAYRTLAKRFHPDFNLGDRAAEQRTKEINTAYRILTDPQTRAAYDDELASRRAQARRRFWRSVATGVAAFAVTAGLVPLVLLMRQDGPRPRPEAVQRIALAKSKGAEAAAPETPAAEPEARPEGEPPVLPSLESKPTTREDIEPSSERAEIEAVQPPQDGTRPAGAGPSLVSLERAGPEEQPPVSEATPAAAAGRAKPAVWKLYRNARAGFALKYPADVFAAGAGADEDDDRLLVSRDGQALLRISAAPNAAAASPADYRRRLIEQRYAGAAIDYQPQREDWFVLSGTVGQEMFYERVTFSCDRRRVHGWLLVYPVAERTYFDPIVEEMHRSYRVEPLSATRCGTIEPGEGVRAGGHKGRRPPQT